jgi:hypothetical protein
MKPKGGAREGAGAPKGSWNRRKGAILSEELKKAATPERLKQLSTMVWKAALEGDLKWIEFLTDRIDGKPVQATEITAEVSSVSVTELSDEQLLAIAAAGSSDGTAEASSGPQEPAEFH